MRGCVTRPYSLITCLPAAYSISPKTCCVESPPQSVILQTRIKSDGLIDQIRSPSKEIFKSSLESQRVSTTETGNRKAGGSVGEPNW